MSCKVTVAVETVMHLNFSVPLIPPSVNHYKVRRFYNSPEAKAFIDAVCIFSHKQAVGGKFYEVDLTYYLPENQIWKCDSDNFEKVSFDALKTAGVISDDRYIVSHHNHKRAVKDPRDARTEYTVRGMF
jgi:Holliday junction resolvase RusA-like endonuclease